MIKFTPFPIRSLLVCLSLIIVLLLVMFMFDLGVNTSDFPQVEINNKKIVVSIATTDSQRSQGLSGQRYLHKSRGMLFMFEDKNVRSFWNKDMKFPIDIVWLNDDVVVGTTSLPIYSRHSVVVFSTVPVNNVLEINKGLVKELNIKKGTKIRYINTK